MGIPKGGVAFFDSGIGGLTVLKACQEQLKNEIFYYYGDNAHAPYGNLPHKKIKKYVRRAFRKFSRLQVKAVVLACNTVTAVYIDELRKKYPFPIIGTEPAIMTAARAGGEVFVLSTRATYESKRFCELCKKARLLSPQASIKAYPCDGLAGEIEKHLQDTSHDYSACLPKGKPASVVLGCTHYIFLKETIARHYGCTVYDGNEGVARRLQTALTDPQAVPRFSPKKKIFRFCRPFLTTFCKVKQKTNKRSRNLPKKTPKINAFKNLFFLGKQREKNAFIYKQMFGL